MTTLPRTIRTWGLALLMGLHWTAAGQTSNPGPIVQLPPLIVEDSTRSVPWLHARTADGEYLSNCSAETTRDFVAGEREASRLLRTLIPARFLAQTSIPEVTVLTSQSHAAAAPDAVTADTLHGGGNPQFLPNLRLADVDELALFASLDESTFDGSRMVALPSYVELLLRRNLPAAPDWLCEGLVQLYAHAALRDQPITLPPFRWLSAEESRLLGRDPDRPRILLSLGELLAAAPKADSDPASAMRAGIWRAEAELFCRWALDPASGADVQPAFWKFAQSCGGRPATEQLFQECFGFGFAAMRDRLSDYLPLAVKNPIHLPVDSTRSVPIEVRPATDDEIARLRGEWERLEIGYVRARYPQYVEQYTDRARRTLNRAFQRGDRDPRLLSSLGLCAVDSGKDADAVGYLEQAVAAQVVRPRAYYELARLRCAALIRQRPATKPFSADELGPVTQPLRVALSAPPLPQAYALMTFVWQHCNTPPPEADVRALKDAGQLFWGGH